MERTLNETRETARHDPERRRMNSIWWAGVLIWVGLALGAEYLDILPVIDGQDDLGPWIIIGVGIWSLALNLYRQSSSWPSPRTSDWIWTAIFVLIAIGTLVDSGQEIIGAVALVVIGVILMGRALSHRE